jgi:hypothetical protein
VAGPEPADGRARISRQIEVPAGERKEMNALRAVVMMRQDSKKTTLPWIS